MMNYVIVSNIVEEKASLPAEEVTVDCSCSTTLEIPFLATIMRKLWGGMVEVGNHDDYSLKLSTSERRG